MFMEKRVHAEKRRYSGGYPFMEEE